jgi:hypothetical protein
MWPRVVLLLATTLKLVLVFCQIGAKDPSLRHFPDSLGFGITRHFGHRFAVGRVLPELRWASMPISQLKSFNWEMTRLG